LSRLRGGEEAAFADLVRERSDRMIVVARRILQNETDAMDALQDALRGADR
jgi:DNA-directed RNA polymerase specialized sigma24 family protein